MPDRFLIAGRASSKAVTSINSTADVGRTKKKGINTTIFQKM
jgi:hypothetical protein